DGEYRHRLVHVPAACRGRVSRRTAAALAAPGGARTAAARPGRDPGAPAHRTAGAALPLIARRRPCRSGGGAAHQGGVAVVGGATGTTDAFLAVGRHVDQAARAAAEEAPGALGPVDIDVPDRQQRR